MKWREDIEKRRSYAREYYKKWIIKKRKDPKFVAKKRLCTKLYRLRHPDRVKACQKKYYLKNKEKFYLINRNWIERNREKIRIREKEYSKKPEVHKKRLARWRARNAVKSGRVKVRSCCNCGAIKNLHKHHKDYSLPTKVIFLCSACHINLHNRLRGEKNNSSPDRGN